MSIDKVKPYLQDVESNERTVSKRNAPDMDETNEKIVSGDVRLKKIGRKMRKLRQTTEGNQWVNESQCAVVLSEIIDPLINF